MAVRHSRSVLLACTAMVAMFMASAASAQNAGNAEAQADATPLKKIVVTKGGRTAGTGVADTPLATETTAETIREKDIENIKDLGNTTEPGVDYVETKPGAPGGMFIRGLGGPRIATLIDDIPIPYLETLTRSGSASPTTGISDSSNSFDLGSLSAIDVVRGADSSRAGSGALAGALVLRTLEPEDLIAEGRDWGGIARLGYDSRDRSFGGSLAAARRFENTSVLFQGGYKRGHETRNHGSDDILGSKRTKPNPADVDQSNLLFKVRQNLEGGHRIGLTAERFNLDNDSDLKTLQGTSYTPGNYSGYDDTRRERVSLDYDYEAPEAGGPIDAARLTAYWQRLTKEAGSQGTRTTGFPYERHNDTEESSFGVSGGLLSTFDTGTLHHTLRFGGNIGVFQYEQFLRAVSFPPAVSQSDVPNVDGTRAGLYLDDEIAIGDTGFALTPGLRYDWRKYDPKMSGSFGNNTGIGYFGLPDGQSGGRLSPKLLATYQATPELQLFAQWSMAYRAPTVTELYSNFTNVAGGYAVVGNPSLKAETGQGFELGANYEGNDLTGKVTVFHNRYRNFIDTTEEYTTKYPAGYFPSFLLNSWANRERVEISGIEVRGRKDFADGWYTEGSLAYAYGKDKKSGEFLRTVAPFKAIVGLGYDQETWGANLTAILSAGMRDDGKPNTFDAPGYGIVNLTGWWEPEQVKGLRVQAGVYNIFDKLYYNAVGVRDKNPLSSAVASTNQPMPFYSEPGRTFKISLTQRF